VGRESASENAQSDTALLVAVVFNLVLVVAGMVEPAQPLPVSDSCFVEALIRSADLVRDTEVPPGAGRQKPYGRIVHWLPVTAFDSASITL
jgi:hypothetical protein